MVDFVTRVVGWKVSGPYKALSYEVNGQWDFDSAALRNGATTDLRQAVAADANAARAHRARVERSVVSRSWHRC
jgi:carboxypeptidase C (cathepsin A)